MASIVKYVRLIGTLLAVSGVLTVAGPVAHNPLPSLCAQADAIIIGPIQVSTVDGRTFNVTLTAERVLKGTVTAGTSIPVVWTKASNVFGIAPDRAARISTAYGLSFLELTAGGSWSLLPTMNGDVVWEDTHLHIGFCCK